MKTQAEIDQAAERMLAAEKLISKVAGHDIFLPISDYMTKEEIVEYEETLDQYERDLEMCGEIEIEEKKKSVEPAPTINIDSAVNTLEQLVVIVNTVKQVVVAVNTVKQLTSPRLLSQKLLQSATSFLLSPR